MKRLIKKFLESLDEPFFKPLVLWLWPGYRRSKEGYMSYYQVFLQYFITQKVFRINGKVPWPVDFRSKVIDWQKIEKGTCSEPGDNMGTYINASGGLKIGNNVLMGPNVIIATTNHYKYDHRKTSKTKGVVIGDNVWIGANCSIVAGTEIGDNVTIGAGCYVRGRIPSNSTVTVDENSLKIIPKTKDFEVDVTQSD
jgi:acyl-[acyl carrier protein]--UDP-N-acetylglucosamine O-acyltransferase